MMKMLDEQEISYQVLWDESPLESESITLRKPRGVFFTTKWCEEQWVRYPWVQIYDNTYRTNNKGLAFFQVVGRNHLGMSFSCGFGLIDNEKQEGFDWLMDTVNAVRERIGAQRPGVTVTDYDTAMRNAVAKVYPDAKPQICIFHLNKNVKLHIAKKWNKQAVHEVARALAEHEAIHNPNPEFIPPIGTPPSAQPHQDYEVEVDAEDPVLEGNERIANRVNLDQDQGQPLPTIQGVVEYSMAGFYKLWVHMVYAASVEDLNLAWEKIQAYFPQQTGILAYLEANWLPLREQWAHCYITKNLNFGNRTTSPVESINYYLKSFIVNGNTPVEQLLSQVLAMVRAMEQRFREALNEQKDRISREYLGVPWLGKAPFAVSRKALKLVVGQYRIMLGAIKTNSNPYPVDLEPCLHHFTARYGIPCSHELLRRHEAKKLQLEKEDFHPF